MLRINLSLIVFSGGIALAQQGAELTEADARREASLVDYEAFMTLATDVQKHRNSTF